VHLDAVARGPVPSGRLVALSPAPAGFRLRGWAGHLASRSGAAPV